MVFKYYQAFIKISVTIFHPRCENDNSLIHSTFFFFWCCRVVRFISTPEILERFVRIEREIVQIEGSIRSNELSTTDAAVNSGEGMLFRSTFVCNFIFHSLLGIIFILRLENLGRS